MLAIEAVGPEVPIAMQAIKNPLLAYDYNLMMGLIKRAVFSKGFN